MNRAGQSGVVGWSFLGPAIGHWQLLVRLARRDVESRFRGTRLGMYWALASPIVVLGLYTLAFSYMIQPRWQETVERRTDIALIYFSGLVLYDFFAECLNRSGTLMLDHRFYIKRMVFPVELLGYVVVFGASFRFVVGSALLLVLYLATHGTLPLGLLLLPIPLFFFALASIGMVWFISAVGTYARDVGLAIGAIAPVLMFISPIFFPSTRVPGIGHTLLYANPLTVPIECVRAVLFQTPPPSVAALGIYAVLSLLAANVGFLIFRKLRREFADYL